MDKLLRMFKAKAPLTIVGVLLIGIVCSAIYDAVVKPGFGFFSQILFDLFTFGSQRAKDYTFSNAALDPSTLPSMSIMVIVVSVVTTLFIIFNVEQLFKSRALLRDIARDDEIAAKIDEIQKLYGDDPQRVAAEIASLRIKRKNRAPEMVPSLYASAKRTFRILGFFSWTVAIVTFIGGWVMVSATNQSLLVWRGFNADINIVTPYVSQAEVSNIRSRFSQMKTEKDYKEVRATLDAIAKLNKLTLRGQDE